MKVWKILAGAAIGVGAVAAAPFTGGGSVVGAVSLAASLAGAGTIATAAGAAAAGAAVGTVLSSKQETKKQNEKNETEARHTLEKQRIVEQTNEILKDPTNFFNYIIAIYAIGLSVANADGHISEIEKVEIDEFVGGVMAEKYPDNVKRKIQELSDDPPPLKTAYNYLEKVGLTEKGWKEVDSLIESVIVADKHRDKKELDFQDAWNILRKSA